MPQLVTLPLSPSEFLRFTIVGLFGAIIVVSFLYGIMFSWISRLIHAPRNSPAKNEHISELEREPTKIIGGLGVFIIALLANNPYIYAISLFIGGLLIASEKFMIHLAAIFNSSRERVADISKQWGIEDLDRDEIKQKQESDAEEVIAKGEAARPQKETVKMTKKNVENSLKEYHKVIQELQKLEAKVFKKIESRISTNSVVLKPYVRVRINDATYAFDAIGQDILSKKILFGLEFKYYSYLHLRSIERLVDRVRPIAHVSNFPIYLVIVFEEIHKDLLDRIQNTTKEERLENKNIGLVYYQLDKDRNLKLVNDVRLSELNPGIFIRYFDA